MSTETKPSRLGRAALVIVALALIAAVYAAWSLGAKGPADFLARVSALWRRPDGGLALQGNVEVRQVNLGFKVAGRIEKLLVDEGDAVKEGQPLARLETVYFEDALAQARAARDSAAAAYAKMKAGNRVEDIAEAEATLVEQQATLQNATQTLDRAQSLLATSAGTIKAYDDAMGAQREAAARVNVARAALEAMKAGFRVEDIDAAAAQLAAQEAAVRTVQQQLADTVLIAPSDGVVESRAQEVGAIVGVGAPVFVLSLTKPVWVRTYVSEPDLTRVKPGMEVEVNPDSRVVASLKGRVGFISTAAEFTPKTVETRELRTALVYRLRVVIDDPGDVLRQGMPVTVNVIGAGESATK
jgi:HlyD family secretion protein